MTERLSRTIQDSSVENVPSISTLNVENNTNQRLPRTRSTGHVIENTKYILYNRTFAVITYNNDVMNSMYTVFLGPITFKYTRVVSVNTRARDRNTTRRRVPRFTRTSWNMTIKHRPTLSSCNYHYTDIGQIMTVLFTETQTSVLTTEPICIRTICSSQNVYCHRRVNNIV